MKKLLESVERSGEQIKFSSDENKFVFSRIASKEYSQVQMLHSDYSPLENGYEYETIKKIKDKDGVLDLVSKFNNSIS